MNLKGGYLTATDAELMIKAWQVSAIEWQDVKKTPSTLAVIFMTISIVKMTPGSA